MLVLAYVLTSAAWCSADPCAKKHCGAGRVCELTEEGEAVCVCISTCPEEVDPRRKVRSKILLSIHLFCLVFWQCILVLDQLSIWALHISCYQWRTQEFFSGGLTNSVEDKGQRGWGSGGGSPLVRGSEGGCNLVQEILFHIIKFS